MNRVLMVLSLLGGLGVASSVQAQYTPPISGYGNIAYTPYINLLNQSMNPAVAYQGIIQPQLQAQARFQNLQTQIDVTRMMPGGVAPPRNTGIADTGTVRARFLQYQQYFGTMGSPGRINYRTQPGTAGAPFGGR